MKKSFYLLYIVLIALTFSCANDEGKPDTTGTDPVTNPDPNPTGNNTEDIIIPTFESSYQTIIDEISTSTLEQRLQSYEGFGKKTLDDAAITQTQDWIEQAYRTMGYPATAIDKQPLALGTEPNANIIVTKRGTKFPDTFIIMTAHYDAVFKGTNDNGSGTVALLEIAEKIQNLETEYSIRFIHCTGEEVYRETGPSLSGSSLYVREKVVEQKPDIRLVFNIDMIGGTKNFGNVLVCEKSEMTFQDNTINQRSEKFTRAIVQSASLYSNIDTEIGRAFGSDYVPFEENGEVITGLYQRGGQGSFIYHEPEDLLENMDLEFYTEAVKTATGAMLHFSRAKK